MRSVVLAWCRLFGAVAGGLTGLLASGLLLSAIPSPWYLLLGQLIALALYGLILLVVRARTRSDVLHELALSALAAPAGLSMIGIFAAVTAGFHRLGLSRGWSLAAAFALAATGFIATAVWWGKRQVERRQAGSPTIAP